MSSLKTMTNKQNQILGRSMVHHATTTEVAEDIVNRALQQAGICIDNDNDKLTNNRDGAAVHAVSNTTTKAGWCLRKGLLHLATLDQGLAQRIAQHGIPTFYTCAATAATATATATNRHQPTQDLKDPSTNFESLCRIIVGQFISGKAARAAWRRVLSLLHGSPDNDAVLSPHMILQRAGHGGCRLVEFQQALGLTKNKARALFDLALHFHDGRLSEEMLGLHNHDDDDDDDDQQQAVASIRKALLQVRGIGEWSCDMFLLFTAEHGDILPLGDLGVRKGISQHFFHTTTMLCPKKGKAKIEERLDPFRPYRSLVSYYMWRVADTPGAVKTQGDVDSAATSLLAAPIMAEQSTSRSKSTRQSQPLPETPPRKRARRSSTRTVTP